MEKRFYQRLNAFYQEYYLTGLQQMAVSRFIKSQLADKSNPNVEHIRPWILAKINQTHIAPSNPLQKGCPDIVPGLRAKPWWYGCLLTKGKIGVSLVATLLRQLQTNPRLTAHIKGLKRLPTLPRTLLDLGTQGKGRGGQRIDRQWTMERLLPVTTQHEV